MKAAPFDYLRPDTLQDACDALAAHEDARLIAGGQTLVPMMAMRLARPSLLVDIARLPELSGVTLADGAVTFGACIRQAEAEHSPDVRRQLPLLARALPFVGHAPTRNRGTLGGSVANGDPAAEIPLVLVTLGGHVEFQTSRGKGRIAAQDFFDGPMMTRLPADACLTQLSFPVWPETRVGTGFCEVSARQSDFAYVAVAAQVALDDDGCMLRCAVGLGGAAPMPTALTSVAEALVGEVPTQARVRHAAQAAVETLEIMVDAHASRAYRQRVAAHFIERALLEACADALARSEVAA